jgi:hypothetical protein
MEVDDAEHQQCLVGSALIPSTSLAMVSHHAGFFFEGAFVRFACTLHPVCLQVIEHDFSRLDSF